MTNKLNNPNDRIGSRRYYYIHMLILSILLSSLPMSGCITRRIHIDEGAETADAINSKTLPGEWFAQLEDIRGRIVFRPDGTFTANLYAYRKAIPEMEGAWSISGDRFKMKSPEAYIKYPDPPAGQTDPLDTLRRRRDDYEWVLGDMVDSDDSIIESSLDHFILRDDEDGDLWRFVRVDEVKHRAPDVVLEADDWRLEIYFRNQAEDVRSGPHGILSRDGEAVAGNEVRSLKTPLGALWYYGSERNIDHLDHISGWNFASEKELIYSSQAVE